MTKNQLLPKTTKLVVLNYAGKYEYKAKVRNVFFFNSKPKIQTKPGQSNNLEPKPIIKMTNKQKSVELKNVNKV